MRMFVAAKVSLIGMQTGAFQAESWVAIPHKRVVEPTKVLIFPSSHTDVRISRINQRVMIPRNHAFTWRS
jgi:hypothetical protein